MERTLFCAVAIDDVRDVFRAPPELAARLRAVAAEAFAPPTPTKRGWLGPLTKRHRPTEVDPSVPSQQDAHALLTGAYVPPGRQRQCWGLLNLWLISLSRATAAVALDADGWVAVEWELARAGLNSDYAVRSLFDRPLSLPLAPLPGQVAGYAKHVHAVETLDALAEAAARADLSPEGRDAVASVVGVLRVAAEHGLDVVVVGAPD
ncbi:MAG TPA: hypothetical protein PJ992_00230 [Arachnia sp.]|jgi:hypothetical protein|nr:hypothetical protein [Arachnia sp.]HMR14507.1 hypothetical protein [Arachnia sp.]